jgi:predicted nucleic-acid-binding protein
VIALDTNVVVRFLTQDEPGQAARAKALIEAGSVFIPKTVMLETEWVLRSAYQIEPPAIAASFASLLGLATVVVEDRWAIARSLAWYGQSLDFADALHQACAQQADAFATFDRRLQRKGRSAAGAIPIFTP